MADKLFDILIGFDIDEDKARKAVDSINKLDDNIDKLDKTLSKTEKSFARLTSVGVSLGAVSAVILAPAILSAENYIKAVDGATDVSRRWLAATAKQQRAQIEFGRKSAEALIPIKEGLASLLELTARVDPAILQAGLAAGGLLALTGAIGVFVGAIGSFATQSAILITQINRISAVQAAGGVGGIGARLGVGGAAIAAGTGIGLLGVRAAGRATGDERLEQAGLDDALEILVDLIKKLSAIIGLGNILIAEQIADTIIKMEGTTKKFIIRLESVFDELVAGLANGILDINEFFGDLSPDLGLAGDAASVAASIGIPGFGAAKELFNLAPDLELSPELIEALTKISNQEPTDINERLLAIDTETSRKLQDNTTKTAELIESFSDFILPEASEENDIVAFFTDSEKQFLDRFKLLNDVISESTIAFGESRKEELEDFNEDTLKIESDFQRQRLLQLDDFERTRLRAEQDFAKKQSQTTLQFARDQQQSQAEFEISRKEQIEQVQKDDLKRQRDFARDRERAAEDSNLRLLEAVGRLDATAVISELRGFTTEDRRAREDFSLESEERKRQLDEQIRDEQAKFQKLQAERNTQFQERQAQELARFQEAQERRLEDFERQRDLAQENFNRSQNDRQSEFDTRRAQERKEFNTLQIERRNQFIAERNQQIEFQNRSLQETATYYTNLQRQFDILNNARLRDFALEITGFTASQVPSFDDGGHSGRGGIAMLHENEFVLDKPTTSMLERGTGSLTQSKVQNLFQNRTVGDVSPTIIIEGNTNMSSQNIDNAVQSGLLKALVSMGE